MSSFSKNISYGVGGESGGAQSGTSVSGGAQGGASGGGFIDAMDRTHLQMTTIPDEKGDESLGPVGCRWW